MRTIMVARFHDTGSDSLSWARRWFKAQAELVDYTGNGPLGLASARMAENTKRCTADAECRTRELADANLKVPFPTCHGGVRAPQPPVGVRRSEKA